MLSTIYWILAILVMSLLLVATIMQMIRSYRLDKEFKEMNKSTKELDEKYAEYISIQLEKLKNESEDK